MFQWKLPSLSWDRGLGGGGGPDNICAGRGLRRAKSTPSSDSAMSDLSPLIRKLDCIFRTIYNLLEQSE